MIFAVIAAKLASIPLRMMGRGSSLPGRIALFFCKDLLRKMKLPPLIVAVTGSNGKTSTTELIHSLAKATGKTVICNSEGSNQIEGVATLFLRHATLFGRVKADIAVVESDERFCQYTFSFFAPDCIVVTNLYRDQLTRNGHNEFVAGELQKGLPLASRLILNADDPLTASLGQGRDGVLYFGVESTAFYEKEGAASNYDHGQFCPLCMGRMRYNYRLFCHLGSYVCRRCSYERPEPEHVVTGVSEGQFVIDGLYDIGLDLTNRMFAENLVAAFSVGAEIFSLSGDEIAETLSGYHMGNDRTNTFSLAEKKGMTFLTKHENAIAYNSVLHAIRHSRSTERTVVIVFDRLSRKYSANDASWLWDIDFSLLRHPRTKALFLSGQFANDLAVRMAFAGVSPKIFVVEPDIAAMIRELKEKAVGEIFAMTCFTDMPGLRRAIAEEDKRRGSVAVRAEKEGT